MERGLIGTTGAALALLALERLGLTADDVKLRVSHRETVARVLERPASPRTIWWMPSSCSTRRTFRSRRVGLEGVAFRRGRRIPHRTRLGDRRPHRDPRGCFRLPRPTSRRPARCRSRRLVRHRHRDRQGLAYYRVWSSRCSTQGRNSRRRWCRYDRLIELFEAVPARLRIQGDVPELVLAEKGLLGDDDGASLRASSP